jgi:hypothetical protein
VRGRALDSCRITHRKPSKGEAKKGRGPARSGATSPSANELPKSDQGSSPDEAANGSDDGCPNPIVLQRTDTETGEVEAVEIPCDRKQCPYCGPKMRRRYVGHYTRVFSERPNLKFVTLTLDPKTDLDAEDSEEFIKRVWDQKFVKRVKRRTDGEVEYVASVEKQKTGFAHVHAIMSTTVDEDTLREQWFESGGGVVMESEPVSKGDALARRTGYVMKYAFENIDQVKGNAVLASEGIGYHAEAQKEKRREHSGEPESGRYEYSGPTTGGRPKEGARVTEVQRERFDALNEEARTRKYIRWDDQDGERDLPRGGTRIIYDDRTGETTKERVRKVRDGNGGTSVITLRGP